ncbi:hypothetical protein CC1G_12626 [Coprinopsis cinerea okayama7|uniref:Uncharacterized protein n=1 Tax=Coprinopsis cinerea (strain Okayama-7 / 130 / ATCC MYA-4618 / FGSC 9003) TaxID=240176 RepID=A8NSZ3_COPC7|nr:hypothetical protein CC1G_12626 [Coprinopsis cinerea okayama7\|eukprot:XP_001836122.2 hypothetical protein CC1G_12626 [Coprinopsis cinerea okayama7\
MTYAEIIFTVAKFQHTCLNIHAIITFVTVFWPRVLDPSGKKYPVDHSILGAFTKHLSVMDDLHRAGIPAWYIRPSSRIPSDTIFANKVFLREPTVELRQFHPTPFEPIYRGIPSLKMHQVTQRVGCRTFNLLRPTRMQAPLGLEPSVHDAATGPPGLY